MILNYLRNPQCPFKVCVNEDKRVDNLITMNPVSNDYISEYAFHLISKIMWEYTTLIGYNDTH